jgi:hypothetical protein
METQDVKQCIDKLEKKLKEVFTKIIDSVWEAMISTEEQI